MILPHTHNLILFLMVLSLFCLGSWACTFKLAGKWRFELYYFDFTFGVMLFALIYAYTFGNLGYDGFNFMDSVMNAGKHEWLYAFAAGAIFNFGNVLMMAVVSMAGMTLAFPLALGTALILNLIVYWIAGWRAEPLHLWTGCVVVAVAMVAEALSRLRHEALARAGQAKSTRRPGQFKEILTALAGGVLLGFVPTLQQKATVGGAGLGVYAVWVFFGLGVVVSTFAMSMFLLNVSMQGDELSVPAYIKSSPKQHFMGLAGGGLWCTGAIAGAVAYFANVLPGVHGGLPEGATPVGPVAVFVLGQSVALLAAFWGILVWKDEKGGDSVVRILTALTLLLFAGGVALMAIAQVIPTAGQ
jgi:glucose uptake protein